MSRRLVVCALLLSAAVSLHADKRRASGPSETRCVVGILTIDVFVQNIAVDATDIYYLDSFDNELFRVPKNGGAKTFVARFPEDFVIDIAVDESDVYVATLPGFFEDTFGPGTVHAVAKTTGAVRTLATGVIFPAKLVLDDTHVYWVSVGTVDLVEEEVLSDGKIERVRKDGTGREALASALSAPLSIDIDDTHVYFSEAGEAVGNPSAGMRRVAKSGGSVQNINNDYIGAEIQLASSDLVFYGGRVDFSNTGIFRMPKTGGTVQTLALGEEIFAGPRVFDGQVYYVTYADDFSSDRLMRVPLAGGTPAFLYAPDIDGEDFEVDACGVVYGNYFGELRRGGR